MFIGQHIMFPCHVKKLFYLVTMINNENFNFHVLSQVVEKMVNIFILIQKENNTWFIGSDLITKITNSTKFDSSNDYKWLLQELEVGDSYQVRAT